MFVYIGTSTLSGASRGLYRASLDEKSGKLGEPRLAVETPNPTFLAFSPDRSRIYSTSEFEPLVAGYAIDPASGDLRPLAAPAGAGSKPPSHLSIDPTGRMAVLSHYHSGFIASVAIGADGLVGSQTARINHSGSGPNRHRQDIPHPHSAIFSPDNMRIAVCDLSLDRIFLYAVDVATGSITSGGQVLIAAPGSGPRHSVFTPDGRFLYVVNELNSTVACYAIGDEAIDPIQVITTLPSGFNGANICSEIRLSPDSRYLYAGNRGHDSIASFTVNPATGRLKQLEVVPSGGSHPRHFSISPDGRWLLCVNRDANNLVPFKVAPGTGRLTPAGKPVQIPQPVCVLAR